MDVGLELFLNIIVKSGFYNSSTHRLKLFFNDIFRDISIEGKSLLEIGGGSGIISLYSIILGATRATNLEPILAGSETVTPPNAVLKYFPNSMFKNKYNIINSTIQDYNTNTKYDIIISNASINHLDEEAVQSINNPYNANIYISIFKKLHKFLKKDGILIITDCSRNNFFNFIGLKNPFMPTIEWEKHQNPEMWLSLLEYSGFQLNLLDWSVPNLLGEKAKTYLNKRWFGYFTLSHFRLCVVKRN